MSNTSKVKVHYFFDPNVEMEALYVNGKSVGYGNTWDCHGYHRLRAIETTLGILGIKYELIKKDDWNYEEPPELGK